MIDRDRERELASQVFGLVDLVQGSTPYKMNLEDLDSAVHATIEGQVEAQGLDRAEADIVYSSFNRIFLQKGRIR